MMPNTSTKVTRCHCAVCCASKLLPLLEGEAASTPAFSEDEMLQIRPTFDQKSFKRGQVFFERNFFSVLVGHLVGLISLMSVDSIHDVLSLTGMSKTPKTAFDRYFSTILHVKKWYESGFPKPGSTSWNSLKEVSNKHARSSKMALSRISYQINQFDVVLTQWAFVGPIVLEPTKLGIHSDSKASLDDFIHFWSIMGHFVGVHERFNLCLRNTEDVRRECVAILHNFIQPAIRHCHFNQRKMSKTVLSGLNQCVPVIDPSSFQCYSYYVLDTTDLHLRKRWQYAANVNLLQVGFHIRFLGYILRIFFNFLLRLAIFIKKNMNEINMDSFRTTKNQYLQYGREVFIKYLKFDWLLGKRIKVY